MAGTSALATLSVCRPPEARAAVQDAPPVAAANAGAPPAADRFGQSVKDAVGLGVGYLEAAQDADGGWTYRDGAPDESFAVGVASLCGLALLEGGVAAEDEHVRRARRFVHDEIRRHWFAPKDMPVLDAYSAGLSIAFLIEAGAPRSDDTLVRTVRMLEDAYSRDGFWDYRPNWTSAESREEARRRGLTEVPRRGGGNVSATLYAVIGLRAAQAAGIAVDNRGLELLLPALRARQSKDGGFFYFADEPAMYAHPQPPYLGGTCSALGAYLMAGEILGTSSKPQDALADATVKRALSWLDSNAGARPAADRREPLVGESAYEAYAQARIGLLLGTGRLAGRPWIEEVAAPMLAAQDPGGSWDPGAFASALYSRAVRTAFGVLFLARRGRRIGEPAAEPVTRR